MTTEILECDYRVILMDLPETIPGFIQERDGYYTIVINSRLSMDDQREALAHELDHLRRGDMSSDLTADSIEAAAHGV